MILERAGEESMSKILLSIMGLGILSFSDAGQAVTVFACPARSKCDVNVKLAKNEYIIEELVDKIANMFSHPNALKDNTYGTHIYITESSKTGSVYPKDNSNIKGLRLDYEGPTSNGTAGNFQLQYGRGIKNGGCYASLIVPLSTKISKETFKSALVNSIKTGVQQCIHE